MMDKDLEKEILLNHSYDGIQELDNKLPPWWLYLFYITIIWSVLYMIHYHVIGTGDSSYVEYMKEYDPDWQAPVSASGFSLGYNSPFAAGENLTPRARAELALQAAQSEMNAGQGITNVSDLKFEDLIIAAMHISTPEDLEKLKGNFPDLYVKYESGMSGGKSAAVAEATPAEPEVPIDPLTDDASLAAGKSIFIANCATCHGQSGEGGIGPNMTDDYYIHGAGMNNTIRVIKSGVPAKGMISWRGILKEPQILEVSSYILTLRGTNPPKGKAPQGEKIVANE